MDSEGYEYLTTGSPICDDFQSLANIFPQVTMQHYKSMPVNAVLKSKFSNIAMSSKQLQLFIRDWFRCSENFKKVEPYNWNIRDWLIDYYDSLTIHLNAAKNYRGTDFRNDMFNYHMDFALGYLTKELMALRKSFILKDVKPAIVFPDNKMYKPEYTWMVEDFLAERLDGKLSKYWKDIEPIIRANLRNFEYYSNTHNALDNTLINIPNKLTQLYTGDKINVDSEVFEQILSGDKGIYLFQTPFMFHTIDSNFMYLKRLLTSYNGKR